VKCKYLLIPNVLIRGDVKITDFSGLFKGTETIENIVRPIQKVKLEKKIGLFIICCIKKHNSQEIISR